MKSMSTRRLAVVMSAAAVFCLAIDAAACTAVLVGKDASTTGRVILGHNEDDDPSLVVRHGYVPPREWPADVSLVDHTDCAKVPRGPRSLDFFWTEVRDAKCGAGSAVSFVNEKGVAIVSDNAGPTKDCLFSTDVMAYAVEKGWWPKEREFDFALAYQDPKWVKIPHNTRRQRYVTSLLLGKEWTDESYPFSVKAVRRVLPDDVKAALSAHPESGGWLRHASDFDETPSACRRQTIESLVIAFGETPADCVAQISGTRPCEKGYRTFKPLDSPLPHDFDDGDAAGRLERFFLPEPALR